MSDSGFIKASLHLRSLAAFGEPLPHSLTIPARFVNNFKKKRRQGPFGPCPRHSNRASLILITSPVDNPWSGKKRMKFRRSMVTPAFHRATCVVVPCLVMICRHVFQFPHASVALQVRLIVVNSGDAPGATQSAYSISGLRSHVSVASACPVFEGSAGASNSIILFSGQVISGGLASVTVTVAYSVAVFPLRSVTVSVAIQDMEHPGEVLRVSVGEGS